jgi:hypothetical protein
MSLTTFQRIQRKARFVSYTVIVRTDVPRSTLSSINPCFPSYVKKYCTLSPFRWLVMKVRGVKIQASLSSAVTDSVARPTTSDADGIFVERPPIASIPSFMFDAALGSTRVPGGQACEKQQLKKAEDVGDVEDICGATLHGFHALSMRSPGVGIAYRGSTAFLFSGWLNVASW